LYIGLFVGNVSLAKKDRMPIYTDLFQANNCFWLKPSLHCFVTVLSRQVVCVHVHFKQSG